MPEFVALGQCGMLRDFFVLVYLTSVLNQSKREPVEKEGLFLLSGGRMDKVLLCTSKDSSNKKAVLNGKNGQQQERAE